MNEILDIIKRRRSVRTYLPDQIKQEEIEKILEAGIYAPTGHNDQPWHFTIIQDKELINHINNETKKHMAHTTVEWIAKMGKNDAYHVFHNAPTVIIVCGKKNATTPLIDCSAAVQNMLLTAESIDIGSCWIGLAKFFFQDPRNIKKMNISQFFQTRIDNSYLHENVSKLRIPDGYEPYFAVTLGYKAYSKDVNAPERRSNVINYIN